jgi:hypothetical protein
MKGEKKLCLLLRNLIAFFMTDSFQATNKYIIHYNPQNVSVNQGGLDTMPFAGST